MPRLGEVHYFIQEESVGSRHYFHSAFECLESFFRNFKMAESCFFLHKISKAEATKQVLALTAGLFTPNGIGNTQVKPCSLINQLLKKVLFLNLICNGIQMILTDFWGFGLLYFNAKFNLIQTRTAALLLCNFPLIPCRLFLKKFIKGYSIEKLLQKSMKS
jgi:hypothetical protein